MATQIAFFNHKGGVSKTTTTFNLGWMLAKKGKKVLLVDCDPQCNLTGMVLGFRGIEDFSSIYNAGGVTNIKDGLLPAFESKPAPIAPVDVVHVEGNPNLMLIPGHIGLAEYEVTLGIAQELSGSLVTLQNLPGSLRHLFNLTAEENDVDYILIDMSPSLGSINQNLLMTSDYFIIPMAPDYFSVMAIESLSKTLPKWKAWANKAVQIPALQDASYPYPSISPKFMGTVVQRFRLRSGDQPSAAFQKWIDDLNLGVSSILEPVLRDNDMLLAPECYQDCEVRINEPILQMSDFNGLIAQSQKHQKPVFDLTDEEIEQSGTVLDNTRASMHRFEGLFSCAADKIICLAG